MVEILRTTVVYLSREQGHPAVHEIQKKFLMTKDEKTSNKSSIQK
jgi:hypothetical protein